MLSIFNQMDDKEKMHNIKVTIGCILGMMIVLGLLTWLNSSNIVKV